jgi:hypothetical protein
MNAIDDWHSLLRPDVELSPRYAEQLAEAMRMRRLTFGDRVHCPFLRPFFLTEADEARMRSAAETIAALGERVVAIRCISPSTTPSPRRVWVTPSGSASCSISWRR